MVKDEFESYINHVIEQIRDAEAELNPVWFDISMEPLTWDSEQKRILLGDKPLMEHEFGIGEKYQKEIQYILMEAFDWLQERKRSLDNEPRRRPKVSK